MRFPDQKKMLLMKFLNAKKNASYEIPTFQTCVLAFHAGGITFYKMKNHLWNHPKGQTCPVSTIGWHSLSGFIVEDWKSDFYNSSSV